MDAFIYLKINGNDVTLELDKTTYDNLLVNPRDTIPDYVNNLTSSHILDYDKIESLSYSLDNNSYCELLCNNGSDSTNINNEQEMWGEAATKLLLDKYEQYLSLVGPMKRFKNKKHLWMSISEDILKILNINKSATQCENRYKTIMKRKKNISKNNRTTGESQQIDPYEAEISKISAIDDSLEPAVRIGVGKCIVNDKTSAVHERFNSPSPSTSSCSTSSSTSRKRPISDVLMDIAKEKEAGRNQRHKEKMDFLRELSGRLFK